VSGGPLVPRPADRETAAVTHPLDPLSSDEIRAAAAVLRRERGVTRPGWRIAVIELREPPKDVVRGHRPGHVPVREPAPSSGTPATAPPTSR
jgi:primary-amine oxidase